MKKPVPILCWRWRQQVFWWSWHLCTEIRGAETQ